MSTTDKCKIRPPKCDAHLAFVIAQIFRPERSSSPATPCRESSRFTRPEFVL